MHCGKLWQLLLLLSVSLVVQGTVNELVVPCKRCRCTGGKLTFIRRGQKKLHTSNGGWSLLVGLMKAHSLFLYVCSDDSWGAGAVTVRSGCARF